MSGERTEPIPFGAGLDDGSAAVPWPFAEAPCSEDTALYDDERPSLNQLRQPVRQLLPALVKA